MQVAQQLEQQHAALDRRLAGRDQVAVSAAAEPFLWDLRLAERSWGIGSTACSPTSSQGPKDKIDH